jgi:ribonuclease H2 subunit A
MTLSPAAGDVVMEETAPEDGAFVLPSINRNAILAGDTYTYYSHIPSALVPTKTGEDAAEGDNSELGRPCVLGVDEAGRGPVLGPMVYGVFFLPIELSDPLLRDENHFDDSKVLTPEVRSQLMTTLCTPGTDLYNSCGYAISALSARDIAANMLKPAGMYNLNAQAMDATIDLIKGVFSRGVNIQEIYVDTIGSPAVYQQKLQRIFPSTKITVAKKADSLYPCVSAASVCAKVTRDVALEVLYEGQLQASGDNSESSGSGDATGMAWGSGYPSDARCVSWLKANMHPVFGWGPECRFSWGTVKDMLDAKGKGGVKVEWPVEEDGETSRVTDFFVSSNKETESDELGTWFGKPVGLETF